MRLGRKKVIVYSLLGLSIFTVLGAVAPNLHLLIIFRFLQGLFIPGVVASAIAYITEESSAGSMISTMACLCDRNSDGAVFAAALSAVSLPANGDGNHHFSSWVD